MQKEAIMKKCPICGNPIGNYPALSRKDNKTEICSDCGQQEAIDAFIEYAVKKKTEKVRK